MINMDDFKGAWYPTNANKAQDKKKEQENTDNILRKRLDIDLIKDKGGKKDDSRR